MRVGFTRQPGELTTEGETEVTQACAPPPRVRKRTLCVHGVSKQCGLGAEATRLGKLTGSLSNVGRQIVQTKNPKITWLSRASCRPWSRQTTEA